MDGKDRKKLTTLTAGESTRDHLQQTWDNYTTPYLQSLFEIEGLDLHEITKNFDGQDGLKQKEGAGGAFSEFNIPISAVEKVAETSFGNVNKEIREKAITKEAAIKILQDGTREDGSDAVKVAAEATKTQCEELGPNSSFLKRNAWQGDVTNEIVTGTASPGSLATVKLQQKVEAMGLNFNELEVHTASYPGARGSLSSGSPSKNMEARFEFDLNELAEIIGIDTETARQIVDGKIDAKDVALQDEPEKGAKQATAQTLQPGD